MVFPHEDPSLVYDYKLSSVGPGRAVEPNVVYDLSGLDLAMKLHYLRGVYFFSSHAIEGLTNMRIKETMFYFFDEYFHTCGRFRRSDLGRPFLKCNDCGARFIEAHCDKTIAELLEMDWASMQKVLASQQVIGPELSFSPPLLFQVTRFRCGGISLGLSWAHVLGDVFSASDFINRWVQIVNVLQSTGPLKTTPKQNPNPKLEASLNPTPLTNEFPLSLKLLNPVGDHWITTNDTNMETFSFPISPAQIDNLELHIPGPFFESLSALVWKSIAKLRQESEPKTVTVFKHNPKRPKWVLTNSQIISSVKADFSVIEADPRKLASLLADKAIDETTQIEESVEKDQGLSDYVVYGANLSFVDWQEGDFYGLEFEGHKPEFVSYVVQGVGENGVVLVLPGPKFTSKDGGEGRLVTLIFPDNEISELKSELKKNGLLLEENIE